VCTAKSSADKVVKIIQSSFPLTKLYVRSSDRLHAIRLRRRGVVFEQRETFESALVFGRATLLELGVEQEAADAIVENVRRLDAERLVLQETDGHYAGSDLIHQKNLRPEPLVKPKRESQALSEETRSVTSNGERAKEDDTTTPIVSG